MRSPPARSRATTPSPGIGLHHQPVGMAGQARHHPALTSPGDLFSGAFEAIRSNPVLISATIVIMLLVSLIASVSILVSGLGYESVINAENTTPGTPANDGEFRQRPSADDFELGVALHVRGHDILTGLLCDGSPS